jgi:hypothetical protein
VAAINSKSDEDKYVFARYRLGIKDSTRLFELAASVTDQDVRGRIYLEHAQKLHAMDHADASNKALKKIIGLSLTDPSIGKQMAVLEIMTLVQMGRAEDVVKGLKQNPMAFIGKDRKYAVYIDAISAELAGDTTNAAKHYRWLGTHDVYFEDGLIAAAQYFQPKGNESYNMLVDGILHHPSSIRIRKAYAIESARQGYDSYAESTLEELKTLIDAKDHVALTARVKELLNREED